MDTKSIERDLAGHMREDKKDYELDQSWLTKKLLRSFQGSNETIAAATSVLYRIILHHATYPFKPEPNTKLTSLNLAISVALLTTNDRCITFAELPTPVSIRERYRNWNDRARLLFQSLCSTNWSVISNVSHRGEHDDEDLVAVLYGSMPQSKFTRTRFLPVAATLPSSHSRKLDGQVSLQDLRALLSLIMAGSAGDRKEGAANINTNTESVVNVLSQCFPNQDSHVGWDEFRAVTADSMPLLLTELASFVSKLFPIERHRQYRLYPVEYSCKVPSAMTRTEIQDKKSFLTSSQLSQLGLAVRRQILDSLELLQQEESGSFSSSDICKMFNNSPRSHFLFLIRGMANHEPLILACWLPFIAQLERSMKGVFRQDPLWVEVMDSDCIVQLSPTHRALRDSSAIASAETSTKMPDDLSITLGDAHLWFAKGLTMGRLRFGKDTLSFTTNLLEIWGQRDAK